MSKTKIMKNRKKRRHRGSILTGLGVLCLVIGAGSLMFKAGIEAEMNNSLELQLRMMVDGDSRAKANALFAVLTAAGWGGLALGTVLLSVGLVLLLTLPPAGGDTPHNADPPGSDGVQAPPHETQGADGEPMAGSSKTPVYSSSASLAEHQQQLQVREQFATGVETIRATVADAWENPRTQQGLDTAKTALNDALETVKYVAVHPVSHLPEARGQLDAKQAIGVGIVCVALFSVGATAATYGVLSGLALRFTVGTTLLLLLAGLVSAAGMMGLLALARKAFGASGDVSDDVFVTGIVLLPASGAALLIGLLGWGSVAMALSLFAGGYVILALYSGCRHVAELPEKASVPAVPVILTLSIWFAQLIFRAVIG